jgi:glyoxylase-like metal-dependent hydrolase (beta-lactamase superfamily II)
MKERLALAAVVLLASAPTAAQRFDDVEITAAKVAGNVYRLEGAGGNIGASIGPDGVLLVDDQYAPLVPKIEAALAKLGGGAPRFVLNTHWHGDHTGGNAPLADTAAIIAHTNVRERMARGATGGAREVAPARPEALPVITFDDALSIHFNGEEIRAYHLPPGHTDGDVVVWFTESNVVHLGDVLFNKLFPFVDLDSGGSVEGLLANVERLLGELPADAKLIAGHGPLATMEDLARYRDMLAESIALVRERKAAGQTLEEVQAAGLPDRWQDWSWRFIDTDRWLGIVYESL